MKKKKQLYYKNSTELNALERLEGELPKKILPIKVKTIKMKNTVKIWKDCACTDLQVSKFSFSLKRQKKTVNGFWLIQKRTPTVEHDNLLTKNQCLYVCVCLNQY